MLYAEEEYKFIHYNYSDGSRIARYSPYATYNQDNFTDSQMQNLSFLNKKLERLTETLRKSTQYDSLTVEQSIKNSIVSYLNSGNNDDFNHKSTNAEKVQSAFDQRLLQSEGSSYISSVINSIEDEISNIYQVAGSSSKSLYSPSAGYFYSRIDGYEYLNMSDYKEPTVATYESLMQMPQSEISDYAVGKLQHYSYWAFIAEVPSSVASELYVGKSVTLEFEIDEIGATKVSTFVDYISRSVNNKNAVRFRCGTLTAELFGIRKQSPHMILKTYTGLKVSNEALRVVDGVTGVYVISAQRILFKPIEIVFVTDEYSLVKPLSTSAEYSLKAQDEVIIGGKGLEDKKIFNFSKND